MLIFGSNVGITLWCFVITPGFLARLRVRKHAAPRFAIGALVRILYLVIIFDAVYVLVFATTRTPQTVKHPVAHNCPLLIHTKGITVLDWMRVKLAPHELAWLNRSRFEIVRLDHSPVPPVKNFITGLDRFAFFNLDQLSSH